MIERDILYSAQFSQTTRLIAVRVNIRTLPVLLFESMQLSKLSQQVIL